jgi:hypothetical protein
MINTETLCKNIETFSKEDQIEILKIIYKDNIEAISENNNGCFINMSDISLSVIEEMHTYVEYVLKKNNDFQKIENEKIKLKNNINDT